MYDKRNRLNEGGDAQSQVGTKACKKGCRYVCSWSRNPFVPLLILNEHTHVLTLTEKRVYGYTFTVC